MENSLNKKTIEDMTDEEVSRWLCLFEAVNYVATKAEKLGIDINKNDSWIKPLAFKNYISEMYQSTLINYKMGDVETEPRSVKEFIYRDNALHS